MFDLVASSEVEFNPDPEVQDTIQEIKDALKPRKADETPEERANEVEKVTRRKMSYALYQEDCYTMGVKPKAVHEVAKADLRTYYLKADRIIGWSQ